MRRMLLLCALALVVSLLSPPGAEAQHRAGPCSIHSHHHSLEERQAAVRQIIRCATRRWSVPGGFETAMYYARRESGLRPEAYNASSCASGVYQHICIYWPGRAGHFLRDRWDMGRSAFNGRANVLVSIRMVHAIGSWCPHWC